MNNQWAAPYRWTIASPAWIIAGPSAWPEVPWQYIWKSKDHAEAWLREMRKEYGETSLRVVPIPFTGAG